MQRRKPTKAERRWPLTTVYKDIVRPSLREALIKLAGTHLATRSPGLKVRRVAAAVINYMTTEKLPVLRWESGKLDIILMNDPNYHHGTKLNPKQKREALELLERGYSGSGPYVRVLRRAATIYQRGFRGERQPKAALIELIFSPAVDELKRWRIDEELQRMKDSAIGSWDAEGANSQ